MSKAIKKIAIVGPESTGKSTLAKDLAAHYQTEWVPEFAREYLDQIKRPYKFEDLSEIAKGQLNLEQKKAKNANDLLFCDTNLIVIKVWSEFKYGKCEPQIIEQIQASDYDLHLLTDIDFPWTPDPLREHPDKRQELFDIYVKELEGFGFDYEIISGHGNARLDNAISAINSQ